MLDRSAVAGFFVQSLFAQANEILDNQYYRGLKDEDYFQTKLRGVTFHGCQERISEVEDGEELRIARDLDNPVDPNAIGVFDRQGGLLGYLRKEMAAVLAEGFDRGVEYACHATAVTGRDKETLGLNVYVQKKDYIEEQELQQGMEVRKMLARLSPEGLMSEIRRYLLGQHDYREKQRESLDLLFEKKNTLTVMGTGRGKSAIFQSYATYKAIRAGEVTCIIYPLRALVNDQYEALKRKLSPIGIRVFKANGSLTEHGREKLRKALRAGDIDLILTTPEWLKYHLERVKGLKDRVKTVVIDEAHHIGVDGSFRPVYQEIPMILRELGNPLTLAVTATANDDVADSIIQATGARRVVIDQYIRTNMRIEDRRNCFKTPRKNQIAVGPTKESYIASLMQKREKIIVYVNSIAKSIEIAENLRERVPEMADQICFYNAGLTSKERLQVEEYFRDGEIRVVVSTKAFGEGIDIPDIRHVVLYHMNFDFVEYNQQCGRVSRDGQPGTIHLIYGEDDMSLNQFILDVKNPDHEFLTMLYKLLAKKKNVCRETDEMIAKIMTDIFKENNLKVDSEKVQTALQIMEELNMVELSRDGVDRVINLLPATNRVSLLDSPTYAEGEQEKAAFKVFAKVALGESAELLLKRINRPIYPKKYLEQSEEVAV